MRAVVNYTDGPVGWLDWQPDPFGVQVTVDCEIPSGAPPLLRCWGKTGGEPLLVGLPAPEGGRLRLHRHLSRETLKGAGCAAQPPSAFYLSERPQQAVQPAPSETAVPTADAAIQTGDAVLDTLLREGTVRTERYAEGVRLRCPFAPDRPFALAPAFVLCRVEGEEAILDWTKKDAAGAAASKKSERIT